MAPFRTVRTDSPSAPSPYPSLTGAPADRDVSVQAQAAAASAAAAPAVATPERPDTSTGDGAADESTRPDPAAAPGLERRNLVFAVRDGEVVAVVTDQRGVAVRTVPPEELEEVRRAQARAGILVDVKV